MVKMMDRDFRYGFSSDYLLQHMMHFIAIMFLLM